MATNDHSTRLGDRETAYGVSVPGLPDYLKTHRVWGMPPPGDLNLKRDCTRLILYNVQSHTTAQIWHELRACLGGMSDAIVKIKRVSGLNRHPHADLWVHKSLGSAFLSTIRARTKIRMTDWGTLAAAVYREEEAGSHGSVIDQEDESTPPPRDDGRSVRVQGWRLALWQPWRERRMIPSKPELEGPLRRRPPLTVGTYNSNGFWSKIVEIGELLDEEAMAVLALQETLVSDRHYPLHMQGYRSYTSNAKEDFRGIATLVSNELSSFEVPHGLHWMIHVKVFGYAGLSSPVHFLNVYLKSGGNHRRTRKQQLQVVKKIVAKIIERDGASKVVVLGDLNEPEKQLLHHLNMHEGNSRNYLFPAHFVGNRRTHFPMRGEARQLDHILLTEQSQLLFRAARVLRCYNSSDHRPVVMTPYADTQAAERRERPARAAFDSKMMYLKGDLIVNDNAWVKLLGQVKGELAKIGDDTLPEPADGEQEAVVSAAADKFIATFDKVCRKHDVKKVHKPGSKPEFPRKLRLLQQAVHKHSSAYHNALDNDTLPDEGTCVRLNRAQMRFKKAKKAWQIRVRQQFYAHVADDFIANDHKNVWSRLRAQVNPSAVVDVPNPVKNREGVLQHSADRILEAMKEHYEDLLTYDPNNLTNNGDHWAELDLGEQRIEAQVLNEDLLWPEILLTIRGMNRNTAPGKDEVHINVLKIMVREECMAALKKENPHFRRPDNVYVDLSEIEIHKQLKSPLTNLGKAFYVLIESVWLTTSIPQQWREVHIVNLFKGGDSEDTNNYRGISLISCALKVLLCLMANRLSKWCEDSNILSTEQAGFRPREEAVAQATALAEIVRRRFLEGYHTLGTFVDFKKAYDRVYHAYLFRLLHHVGVRGRFLQMIVESYSTTQYSVRVGLNTSALFTPTRGAKQGDPLSPILFDIFIDNCLGEAVGDDRGVAVTGVTHGRIPGLVYADDLLTLSDSPEEAQRSIMGIYGWGQKFGMEMGYVKCGVLCWYGRDLEPGTGPPRRRGALDFADTAYERESVVLSKEDLERAHLSMVYSTPEGVVPTVTAYKYLGITMNEKLGDPRRIVTGERSMELEFAYSQAKKGMRQLHVLRPFLTDRFCPIQLKVALVRNLIYPTMLYGSELIGFQKLHAEPMQRVVNIAAKWIVGLAKSNTSTDAFTLCFELGLPPIFLEMSASRARLGIKLEMDPPLKTWIQILWDEPARYKSRHLTWVSQTMTWLEKARAEKHKYSRIVYPITGRYRVENRRIVEEDDTTGVILALDVVTPLRPWAQLGRCFEMSVRSNQYRSELIEDIRAEMLGEGADGALVETPLLNEDLGLWTGYWFPEEEYPVLENGVTIPRGRTRSEVAQLLLVRHVVLERLMASQRTKSWTAYDSHYYGVTRGYLREAVNRTDLAEGVRWLVCARTGAFPQVERAWQHIKRSGRTPGFERGRCPLCLTKTLSGMELAHLLVTCDRHQVKTCRLKYLEHNISYLTRVKAGIWESAPNMVSDKWGVTDQNLLRERVVGVYLLGGLVRLARAEQGSSDWFDWYQLGFGHFRLVTPGFTTHHYINVAQFLQEIAPLFAKALGQELYDGGSVTDSLAEGSLLEEDVNQDAWLPEQSTNLRTLIDREVWQETREFGDQPGVPWA